MAGRGRLPPQVVGGRVNLGGPATLIVGPGVRPLVGASMEQLLEQKVLAQHEELQRLLSENQRLATTHLALRQELAATQQELQRVHQAFTALHNEREQQARALVEKTAKLEADLRATEPLKAELENAKAGAHKLLALRQELSNQITQLTTDLQRSRADVQQVPSMKAEMDAIRQELQRARNAFDFEKKANAELLEQRGVMEKNLVSMAREVEKLRAELTNAEKKGRVGSYGGAFGASDPAYPSVAVASYGDAYALSQIPVAAESVAPFGSAAATAWGAYELQRVREAHLRR